MKVNRGDQVVYRWRGQSGLWGVVVAAYATPATVWIRPVGSVHARRVVPAAAIEQVVGSTEYVEEAS